MENEHEVRKWQHCQRESEKVATSLSTAMNPTSMSVLSARCRPSVWMPAIGKCTVTCAGLLPFPSSPPPSCPSAHDAGRVTVSVMLWPVSAMTNSRQAGRSVAEAGRRASRARSTPGMLWEATRTPPSPAIAQLTADSESGRPACVTRTSTVRTAAVDACRKWTRPASPPTAGRRDTSSARRISTACVPR